MKADAGKPGRRHGWLFTVTPIVAVVLVAIGVVAVVVHNTRHNNTASPTAFRATETPAALSTTSALPTTTSATPAPTTTADDPVLAQQAVQAVDALQTKTVSIGVAILDRNTGQVTAGQNGAATYYSASVIKLFTVTYLLHEQEAGALKLSATMQNNITRALELSDDNAMDAFWGAYGGLKLIPEFVELYGLQNTTAPTIPGEWGETRFSPEDVLRVYQYMLTQLSPADTQLVVNDLHNAADHGADGFDQAFGLLQEPRQPTVKGKQGWMQIGGNSLTLNTTGLLGSNNQYAVAILTRQPGSMSYPAGKVYLNQAADIVIKALGPGIA